MIEQLTKQSIRSGHPLLLGAALLMLSACAVSPICSGALPPDLRTDTKFDITVPVSARVAATPDAAPEVLFPYYSCLAAQGNIEAAYRTGLAYEMGYGVAPDIEKAVKWYRKAALGTAGFTTITSSGGDNLVPQTYMVPNGPRQGPSADAQFRLGLYYLNRNRSKSDFTRARIWFERAIAQGHEEAKQTLESLPPQAPDKPSEQEN